MKKKLALVLLLKNREPALLVSGQTVSNFGNGVALVALTLLVYDTTGSLTKLAWFAAARMTPLVIFLLIGALVMSNLSSPKRRVRVMWIYWTIGTLSALIMGIATNFWEIIFFPIIASPMMIFGNVIWESMMQSEVPRELLGRAGSVDWFVSLGVAPLGLVLAGEIANYVGIRTYFVLFCVICVLPDLYILKSKRINEIDEKRVHPTPAAAP